MAFLSLLSFQRERDDSVVWVLWPGPSTRVDRICTAAAVSGKARLLVELHTRALAGVFGQDQRGWQQPNRRSRLRGVNRRADPSIDWIAMTTKARASQTRVGKNVDDTSRPVWLEATESFYKKLNRIAKECELSRYQALSRGLDALLREAQVRNSALNRNIKSPGQSEVFRRTMGQVSRNYWATLTPEQKRMRAQKSAWARWSRQFQAET